MNNHVCKMENLKSIKNLKIMNHFYLNKFYKFVVAITAIYFLNGNIGFYHFVNYK